MCVTQGCHFPQKFDTKSVSYDLVVGDPGSIFLCAIQGPITRVLWSEQDNWRDNRRKSSNLFVRTIYTNQFTEEKNWCDCSKAICSEGQEAE
jgi:hypothetical protein